MTVDLSEFVSGFLAEAEDHLRSVNANLLRVDEAIQRRQADPRAVRELFRSLHTIKGLAGMVGVEPIVDIAHAMERVLREAEQNSGKLSAKAFEPLLEGTKAIAHRVSMLAAAKRVPAAPEELLSALGAVGAEPAAEAGDEKLLAIEASVLARLNASEKAQLANAAAGRRALQVAFTPSVERAGRGVTITAVRERLAELADIVKVVPIAVPGSGSLRFLFLLVSAAGDEELARACECGVEDVIVVSESEARISVAEEDDAGGVGSTSQGMLRVEVRRVDAAMDALGELLVTKFRLARAIAALAEKGADVRELREVAQETHRKIREVRALVLGLRMIALSELLDRLPILIRGLQTTTGKAVQLRMDLGGFEVDKAVGERLWPVLVHLIRNAVDHGLEAEPERVRVGKSQKGNIHVTCTRSSNSQLELTIADDGAGIDAERVATRAGRPVPADAAALLELIARPGLSTRDSVTSTSGRGMGLDIARRIIVEELGGELRLETALGKGSAFLLKVPVTVAVVEAFRFEAAQQAFLVPVASVEEFVEIAAADVVVSPTVVTDRAKVGLFTKRGRTMPFFELSHLVGREQSAQSRKAIIVKRSDQLFAFGVDRLIDHHEVIVRRLSDPLVDVPGIAGAADLGDGRPTLLLDLLALTATGVESGRAA